MEQIKLSNKKLSKLQYGCKLRCETIKKQLLTFETNCSDYINWPYGGTEYDGQNRMYLHMQAVIKLQRCHLARNMNYVYLYREYFKSEMKLDSLFNSIIYDEVGTKMPHDCIVNIFEYMNFSKLDFH